MKTSAKGLSLIKSFEGCRKADGAGYFVPYLCPAGVMTIGWGHTNAHGRQFDHRTRWTQQECDDALAEDLTGFEREVQRLVRVPLNQGEFDALVSFAYNCGSTNLARSTLLKKLNNSDYEGAAREFAKWNRAGGKVLNGLTRRRAAEAALFRGSGEHRIPRDVEWEDNPMPQRADPPTKNMAQSKTGWAAIFAGIMASLQGLKDQLSDWGLFDPLLEFVKQHGSLMLFAAVVAVAFIFWDRWEKLKGGV